MFPAHEDVGCQLTEQHLDPVIQGSISALERGTGLVAEIIPTLQELWGNLKGELTHLERDGKGRLTPAARQQARRDIIRVTQLVSKLSQAMEYNGRIVDQLGRLRALLAGDADSRTEHEIYVNVTGKGETELIEMMLQAAAQSGKLCPACTAAALNGGMINAKRIEGTTADDGSSTQRA